MVTCGGEERAIEAYTKELQQPLKVEVRSGTISGGAAGVFRVLIYWLFALALWYGSRKMRQGSFETACVRDGQPSTCVINDSKWTGGQVLTVLFSAPVGAFSLG